MFLAKLAIFGLGIIGIPWFVGTEILAGRWGSVRV